MDRTGGCVRRLFSGEGGLRIDAGYYGGDLGEWILGRDTFVGFCEKRKFVRVLRGIFSSKSFELTLILQNK
jgi:hypothetical protein